MNVRMQRIRPYTAKVACFLNTSPFSYLLAYHIYQIGGISELNSPAKFIIIIIMNKIEFDRKTQRTYLGHTVYKEGTLFGYILCILSGKLLMSSRQFMTQSS